MPDDIKMLVDQFAMESFREMADGDYVVARMSYRANLVSQALWASEQAIEKYLKTILLLRRIRYTKGGHSVLDILRVLEEKCSNLAISSETREFIKHIDRYGTDRYLTYPLVMEGREISRLDRASWELRRYCTRCSAESELKDIEAAIANDPKWSPSSKPSLLHDIIDNPEHPAHHYLLRGNRYFGKTTDVDGDDDLGFQGTNSFLSQYPKEHYAELYVELRKLIYLPEGAGDQVLPPEHR
jgi:HEPN domain-containing protein